MTKRPSHPMGPAAGSSDAGVVDRVRVRTAGAAVMAALAAVLWACLGWWWPGWFAGVGGAVGGGCTVAACAWLAAVLARRAHCWARAGRIVREPASSAGDQGVDVTHWVPAACGAAAALHARRPGSPQVRVGRRLNACLLPLRTADGPLAAGRAVLVHPRTDGAMPGAADRIEVRVLGRRGPFLIRRAADNAVFAADGWLLSTL